MVYPPVRIYETVSSIRVVFLKESSIEALLSIDERAKVELF